MSKTSVYECDICDEKIDKLSNMAIFVIGRGGDEVESHVHESCLEEAIEESEALSSIVLHD